MKRLAPMMVMTISMVCTPAWLAGQPVPPVPPTPPAPPVEVGNFLYSHGGFLGLGLQEVTAERAKALKLKEEAGVEVTMVARDSPAEKAGLKVGDVVLQYNGTKVEGFEQFARMVRETPVDREARLQVFRNGAEQTMAVKIGQRPPSFPFGPGTIRMPDIQNMVQGMRSPMLGVDVESISGQFADYFGVKDGVLVREVMRGSPAEKGGLKAGDVILRVDDSKVDSPRDITAKLRATAGKAVAVAVMREHKETTLSVDVPDRRSGRALPVRFVMVNEDGR